MYQISVLNPLQYTQLTRNWIEIYKFGDFWGRKTLYAGQLIADRRQLSQSLGSCFFSPPI